MRTKSRSYGVTCVSSSEELEPRRTLDGLPFVYLDFGKTDDFERAIYNAVHVGQYSSGEDEVYESEVASLRIQIMDRMVEIYGGLAAGDNQKFEIVTSLGAGKSAANAMEVVRFTIPPPAYVPAGVWGFTRGLDVGNSYDQLTPVDVYSQRVAEATIQIGMPLMASQSKVGLINALANAIANTAAHEIGHALGNTHYDGVDDPVEDAGYLTTIMGEDGRRWELLRLSASDYVKFAFARVTKQYDTISEATQAEELASLLTGWGYELSLQPVKTGEVIDGKVTEAYRGVAGIEVESIHATLDSAGKFTHWYRFEGKQGDRVKIQAVSEAFSVVVPGQSGRPRLRHQPFAIDTKISLLREEGEIRTNPDYSEPLGPWVTDGVTSVKYISHMSKDQETTNLPWDRNGMDPGGIFTLPKDGNYFIKVERDDNPLDNETYQGVYTLFVTRYRDPQRNIKADGLVWDGSQWKLNYTVTGNSSFSENVPVRVFASDDGIIPKVGGYFDVYTIEQTNGILNSGPLILGELPEKPEAGKYWVAIIDPDSNVLETRKDDNVAKAGIGVNKNGQLNIFGQTIVDSIAINFDEVSDRIEGQQGVGINVAWNNTTYHIYQTSQGTVVAPSSEEAYLVEGVSAVTSINIATYANADHIENNTTIPMVADGGDGENTLLAGFSGQDVLIGGDDGDNLIAGYGGFIYGGLGNDTIYTGIADHPTTVDGGEGQDKIHADAGLVILTKSSQFDQLEIFPDTGDIRFTDGWGAALATQSGGGTYLNSAANLYLNWGEDQHDQITFHGNLTLAGTLHLSLADGFVPDADTEINFITATGTTSGQFTAVDLSNAMLPPGLTWQLSSNSSGVTLKCVSVVAPEDATLENPATPNVAVTSFGTSVDANGLPRVTVEYSVANNALTNAFDVSILKVTVEHPEGEWVATQRITQSSDWTVDDHTVVFNSLGALTGEYRLVAVIDRKAEVVDADRTDNTRDFAGGVFVNESASGVLQVLGGDEAETFTISRSGSTLSITRQIGTGTPTTATIDLTNYAPTSIAAQLYGGDDVLDASGVDIGVTAYGGTGANTLTGGSGEDTFVTTDTDAITGGVDDMYVVSKGGLSTIMAPTVAGSQHIFFGEWGGTAVFTAQDGSTWHLWNDGFGAADVEFVYSSSSGGSLTVTKNGAGTVYLESVSGLSVPVSYVNAEGDTVVAHDLGAAAYLNGTTLVPASTPVSIEVQAGQITFNTTQHLNHLAIAEDAKVVVVADVTADGTPILNGKHTLLVRSLDVGAVGHYGRLDLNNNGLVIIYSSGSPFSAIDSAVSAAFTNGTWSGAGITSGTAAAVEFLSGLAVSDTSDASYPSPQSFNGELLESYAVVVRHTYVGDADLDGDVDGDDFDNYLLGYNDQNVYGWFYGDFDHNGQINGDDFDLYLAGFNQNGLFGSKAISFTSAGGTNTATAQDGSVWQLTGVAGNSVSVIFRINADGTALTVEKTGAGALEIGSVTGLTLPVTFINRQGTATFAQDLGSAAYLDENDDLVLASTPVSVEAQAGQVTFRSSQHLQTLLVSEGALVVIAADTTADGTPFLNGKHTLFVRGLDLGIAGHYGTLDLNNNSMIVEYTTTSVQPAIQGAISAAFNYGEWNLPGITSTVAAGAYPLVGLGYLESAEFNSLTGNSTFAGEPISSTAVLIKMTYAGDANLTSLVDIDDYFQIDNGFTSGGLLGGWVNGDFDHNGVIDIDDYFLIDSAFTSQGSFGSRTASITPTSTAISFTAQDGSTWQIAGTGDGWAQVHFLINADGTEMTVRKTGTGTVHIVSVTGLAMKVTFVNTQGETQFDADVAPNASAGILSLLSVEVAAGTSVVFSSTQHLDKLTIHGDATHVDGRVTMAPRTISEGTRLLFVRELNIDSDNATFPVDLAAWVVANGPITAAFRTYYGTLDIANNSLIVTDSGADAIADLIRAGTGGVTTLAWNGRGITSSVAANSNNSLYGVTGLGLLRNVSDPGQPFDSSNNPAFYASFEGQALAGDEVIVGYTWYGDGDLNGIFSDFDFALLDAGDTGATQANGLPGWFFADFNGDGQMDDLDFALFDAGWTGGRQSHSFTAEGGTSTVTAQDGSVWQLTGVVGGNVTVQFLFDINSARLTVVKFGSGTLEVGTVTGLTVPVTFVNAEGETIFAHDLGAAAYYNNSNNLISASTPVSVDVQAGQVTFSSSQHLQSLAIADGAEAKMATTGNATVKNLLLIRDLSIGATAKLDLVDNNMIVEYSATTPYSTIRDAVIVGITSEGDYGITSTAPTLDFFRTFAVCDNADLLVAEFFGEQLSTANGCKQIIVKFTYLGDANLDGMVTPDDYAAIDANIGNNNAQWWQGDMNFDSAVNLDDYAVVDANMGAGT